MDLTDTTILNREYIIADKHMKHFWQQSRSWKQRPNCDQKKEEKT